MNNLLFKYKEYMINKNYSENTIDSYCVKIEQYFNWAKSLYSFSELTDETLSQIRWEDIEDSFLPMGNVKPATYNNRHSSVSGFYVFLIRRGIVSENPFDMIEKIKLNAKEPIFLISEESDEILFQVRNFEGENAKRNECMIYVFMESGIRLSELVNLRKQDIRGNRMRVDGKGDKERFAFISNDTRVKLDAYIGSRTDELDYVFVTGRGEPSKLSDHNVRVMVKKYVLLAKIDKNITPHKLRHTFATHYYEKTKDLRKLQEMLGHASSKTTDIYAHVIDTQFDNTIEDGLYD